ncbi:methionine adenosyltransferase [Trueperella abortisuis]|uniref:Methionine adenosyltransferase n=1 Tax=Trueperella abortisuis TaxID=445930 RepID=A0ABT9PIX5_9ACTO|nr:methionine adenosyltransferase [Trueperella abortisuis]MDP9832661.1 S-adenosylmethionine synthetase [Trueperella abortisuis]
MSVVRTAESVCIGHPDKLCDLIADTILDDILAVDPKARLAVEVMATGRRIIVTGEITTTAKPRLRASARSALRRAGYDPNRFVVYVWVRRQSPDIAAGVTTSLEARTGNSASDAVQGAGDQGTVYGYATNETPERLPLPLVLAHDICRRLDTARTQSTITGIHSDGKAQVSVIYDEIGNPVGVSTVVVSVQHDENKNLNELEYEINELVVAPAIEEHLPGAEPTHILVNPSGRFVTGGPAADTGLTGRKLMVDTYGGLAGHGGGAFSGKDPSKVDRTGAYMARLIAKTIVDAGLAEECHVSISYAIGKADPVVFYVDTFGSGQHPDWLLTDTARVVFPLRPAAMIDALGLRAPVFAGLATYGHMGRTGHPWEHTDLFVNQLLEEVRARADQAATHW